MRNTLIITVVAAFVAMAFTYAPVKPVHRSHKTVNSGIKFDKLGMEKALKQAKDSGKLIFIDVHTSWCGPCKEMARTTFQSDEVGKVFNKKFINLKIDAETDADGPDVSKKYSVTAYPTLLFINGDGKLVKRLVGKQSEEKLLSVANGL
ncbi:MAG: thioredoxin family protein [Flavobacteriia bacterium]|nr:thioredoxin family protein [Flavobacteriia bacterium]